MIVPPIPKFHEFSKIFSIGNKISPFFIQLVQILVVKENSWNFGIGECREQLIYITIHVYVDSMQIVAMHLDSQTMSIAWRTIQKLQCPT